MNMNSVEQKMAASDASYQTPIAKLCCRVGITALLFGLFILLSWVNLNFAHQWSINFAWLCYIVLMVYYFFIEVKLALITTVIMFFFTLLATLIGSHEPSGFSITLFLIISLGGIASVLIGHYVIEKKSGSPMSNFQECLIMPLYVVVECLQLSGIGPSLGLTHKNHNKNSNHHTHDQPDDHDNDHESQ
jgi:uncharacterized membrane protein YGL010W